MKVNCYEFVRFRRKCQRCCEQNGQDKAPPYSAQSHTHLRVAKTPRATRIFEQLPGQFSGGLWKSCGSATKGLTSGKQLPLYKYYAIKFSITEYLRRDVTHVTILHESAWRTCHRNTSAVSSFP